MGTDTKAHMGGDKPDREEGQGGGPGEEALAAAVARWIRPEIRVLSAYRVPDAADLIKLDAMENPYAWPPELVEEWLEVLRRVSLNRYPDAAARGLRRRLRQVFQIPADKEILLGNGSDELIQLLILAVAAPGRKVLAPEPAFSMYRMITIFCGLEYVGVPLRADFALDREAMLAALDEHQPAVVFLDYPNNPSGRLFSEADVRAVIEAAPGLVVVDEAYHSFAGASFMAALQEYPHLLILRTLSKMGLAGLRLGLLVGDRAWLREIDKIRLPYNVNVLTQESADFALRHREVLEAQAAAIRRDRAVLQDALAALPGVAVYPSRANFILFRVPAGRSGHIFQALREAGVLVKHLHRDEGLLRDCLRVTVGTPDENRAFLEALREALAVHGAQPGAGNDPRNA